MLTLKAPRGVEFCDGVNRRDFLTIGGLGAMGLGVADKLLADRFENLPFKAVIQLFLVGGPSQLDTWDPKPDAPHEVRSPFGAIATNVAGIEIGEHFPLMARQADKYSIVRTVHHNAAPIHETGHQLMQTGYLFRDGVNHPHMGAVAASVLGGRDGAPGWVALPYAISNTGVCISHAQDAGFLGHSLDPAWIGQEQGVDPARMARWGLLNAVDGIQRRVDSLRLADRDQSVERSYRSWFSAESKRALDVQATPASVRRRYGENTFGQACLVARRLVESGVRLVTVNMFDTVFNQVTWDMHANGASLPVTMEDYRATLCPMFDAAYSTLLEDLATNGLLDDVLVVAMGEFGRTPKINARGGRDHWPGCWSILLAGGGVQGGRVIGRSDETASAPADRPVTPAEVVATVYHSLGIDPSTPIDSPETGSASVAPAAAILELF